MTDRDFPMYYEMLGVSENATTEQIKQSFRYLAFNHHPDSAGINADEEKLKDFSEAYGVLKDAKKREKYDQARRREQAEKEATSKTAPTQDVRQKRGYKAGSQARQQSASQSQTRAGSPHSQPPSSGPSSSSVTKPPKTTPRPVRPPMSESERRIENLRRTASRGDATAGFTLGQYYEKGREGLSVNLDNARLWYYLASKKGHSGALAAYNRLG